MATKHKERYSIPLVIRELQIQTAEFYYILPKNDWNPKPGNTKWAKMQSNRDSLSLLVEVQNGRATFKDNLAISYKTNHLILRSSNPIHKYLPNWFENICPHKSMPVNSRFFFFLIIAPNWTQTRQSSVGKWINKLWYFHNGISFRNKNKWAIKPWVDLNCI